MGYGNTVVLACSRLSSLFAGLGPASVPYVELATRYRLVKYGRDFGSPLLALVNSPPARRSERCAESQDARLGVGPHDDAGLFFLPLELAGVGEGRQIVSPLRRRQRCCKRKV